VTRNEEFKVENLDKAIAESARRLLNFVIRKHKIKSIDEFTCKHHKILAELLNHKRRIKWFNG
jgi:hypothetical protein